MIVVLPVKLFCNELRVRLVLYHSKARGECRSGEDSRIKNKWPLFSRSACMLAAASQNFIPFQRTILPFFYFCHPRRILYEVSSTRVERTNVAEGSLHVHSSLNRGLAGCFILRPQSSIIFTRTIFSPDTTNKKTFTAYLY